MSFEKTFYRLEVSEASENRASWISKVGLGVESIKEASTCDILIIPNEIQKEVGFVFPTGTSNFYQALSEALPNVAISFAVRKEDYAELALHSKVIRLPKMIVNSVILPLVINLISSYVYDNMKDATSQASVELTIQIENVNGGDVSISYKGPPSEISKSILEQAEKFSIDYSNK